MVGDRGDQITHEFSTSWTPQEMIGYILRQAPEFGAFGYRVKQHTSQSAVLVRRYIPNATWIWPLSIGAIALLLGVLSPNSTIGSAIIAGQRALFAVLVAGVLVLVVRRQEHLSISATPAQNGSSVIITGSATSRLRSHILAWETACGPAGNLPA